jgi:colanic acid/amylovoran biosynthesis glycosyltransferase
MASGVPVITTVTGGVGELVADAENGFIVAEKDAAAIADKLKAVFFDTGALQALVCAARKRVEEQYDIKKQNRELDLFIRRMAA